jgi:hypothetical protein
MKEKTFQQVGWRGIELEVPKEWNFVAESGRPRLGHMIFASASAKFEIKWKKAEKTVNSERLAGKLLEKMQSAYKGLRALEKGHMNIFGHEGTYVFFRHKIEGYMVSWCCDRTQRVFTALYVYKSGEREEAKRNFERIFGSFKCHTLDDWHSWIFFDFSFRTPASYQLRAKKVLIGYASLELNEQERHLSYSQRNGVNIQYWNIANVNFRDTYNDPKKWFEKNHAKRFRKQYRGVKIGDFQRSTVNGHEAEALRSTQKSGTLDKAAVKNDTYVWYCSNTNRIYVLTLSMALNERWFNKTEKEARLTETFDKILASVSCHQA